MRKGGGGAGKGERTDRLRCGQSESGLVKVSVIGIGMRSHAGVAAIAFKALAEKSSISSAITTSEIKISILIDGAYAELAVRTLHSTSTVWIRLSQRDQDTPAQAELCKPAGSVPGGQHELGE
jgi:hypothetical protein